MKVSVKICGIRSVESAVAAVDAGADFIGLNFVPTSKRKVREETAQSIIEAVKNQVKVIGVFQNAELNYVNETAEQLGLDFVQLHGNENQSYCEQIKTDIIKAVSLKSGETAEDVIQEMKAIDVPFFLLDRERQGRGDLVNTEVAGKLAKEFKLFLAGGMTPENVAWFVSEVKPFAVDVAGGIETDGKEDFGKIRKFIMNAKGVKL